MNTNWMTWTLGTLIALALAAGVSVGAIPRHPRVRPTLEEAVNAKIQQLRHPDYWMRRDAALALGAARACKAVPALLEALKDEHPEVRKAVEQALSQISETAREGFTGLLCAAAIVPCDPGYEGRLR